MAVRVRAAPAISISARSTRDHTEDRQRLVAAEIMRAVYFETLNRIELSGYDVFNGRVRVAAMQLLGRQAVVVWHWRRVMGDRVMAAARTTLSSSAPGSPA